jgi:branched-chain amino acid aminotransferase
LYERGVSCVTIPLHRENPHAKDTRFIATAQRAHDALPAGVHEGLMVAEDGAILEGLSSNFFAVVGGGLRTERERALFGVTRSLVLEVSQGVVPLDERAVRRGDLASVLEAFITSVSRGILPVVEIDRSTIGEGKPGPVTRTLMQRLARLIEAEAEEL